jgi:hypothetical protein
MQIISIILFYVLYKDSVYTEGCVNIKAKSNENILLFFGIWILSNRSCVLQSAVAMCIHNLAYLIYTMITSGLSVTPHNVIALDT